MTTKICAPITASIKIPFPIWNQSCPKYDNANDHAFADMCSRMGASIVWKYSINHAKMIPSTDAYRNCAIFPWKIPKSSPDTTIATGHRK